MPANKCFSARAIPVVLWLAAFITNVSPAAANTSIKCELTKDWQLRAEIHEGLPAVRFDIVDDKHQLLGRQIMVKPTVGELSGPVLSLDWGRLSPNPPVINCSGDTETRYTRTGVATDVGPDGEVRAVYLGNRSVVVSFYAYGVGGSLFDQIYSIQLDDRTPYEIQVSSTEGQDVNVRFPGVLPGRHNITLFYLSYMPPSMDPVPTRLGELEITMPRGILDNSER